MPSFLDTRGNSTLGIGICARCSRKFSLSDLRADGNTPGLRVCQDDWDTLDPWRLPPPPADDITLDYPRPDIELFPFEPIPVYTNQINGISLEYPTVTWSAVTFYRKGSNVTPQNVNSPAVNLPQPQFLALNAGISGAATPAWPTEAGVEIVDGAVTWLCVGIALLDGITQASPLGPNQ